MGRLAYEFLKGSVPQPAAVLLYMRGKSTNCTCAFLLCGVGVGGVGWFFFLYELNYVFGGGAGGDGMWAPSQDQLFEEQKGERRVVPSRDVPRQPAMPRGQTRCVADATGSQGRGYFSWLLLVIVLWCLLATAFWEEDLGKRGVISFSLSAWRSPQRALELLKVIGETHLPAQRW